MDCSRLEEADLIVRLLRTAPAECLVKRPGSGKVRDTQRHEADPLLHTASIADGRCAVSVATLASGSAALSRVRVGQSKPGKFVESFIWSEMESSDAAEAPWRVQGASATARGGQSSRRRRLHNAFVGADSTPFAALNRYRDSANR
jgi:hypothetical protein